MLKLCQDIGVNRLENKHVSFSQVFGFGKQQ